MLGAARPDFMYAAQVASKSHGGLQEDSSPA